MPVAGSALERWGRRVAADPAAIRRLTIVLLVLQTLVYGVWIGYAVRTDRPVDFASYYVAAEAMRRDIDPYHLDALEMAEIGADLGVPYAAVPIYRYPPHTAALLRPLTSVGYKSALVIWSCLNAAAMIVATVLVAKALGGGFRVPAGLALLLVFAPAYDTLLSGQINGLVLLCFALGLWGLMDDRPLVTAVGLGVGAALKILPFALVLYLFWRRRWRAAIACCVVLAVLTLACTVLVDGGIWVSYAHHAVALATAKGGLALPPNPSVTGLLSRTLGSTDAVRVVASLLSVVLLGLTALLCWPRGPFSRWVALESSLVVAAVVLAPAFTWFHQLTILVLPILVIGDELVSRRRWRSLAALVALVILADLSQPLWYKYWETLNRTGVYRVMSAPFLLSAFVWGIAAALLVRAKWRESGA